MANSALSIVGKVGQYSYTDKSAGRIDTSKKAPTIAKKNNNSSSKNTNTSTSSKTSSKINFSDLRKLTPSKGIVTTTPELESKIAVAKSMSKKSGGWYSNLDYALGGWMPWSLSPTSVRTDKTNIKVIENKPYMEAQGRLNNSNMLLQEQEQAQKIREEESNARFKSQLDLYDTSWLEKLGIGISPQERIVQKGIERETFAQISPNLTDAAIDSIMNPPSTPTITEGISDGFKWGIPLLIGVGAFMLLKK